MSVSSEPNARTYDQLCPVAASLDVLGDRWTMLILRDLLWWGPQRFGELLEANRGISPTLLTTRLRQLGADGLICGPDDDRRYDLTDAGRDTEPIIEAMYRYGQRLLVESGSSPRRLAYLVQQAGRTHQTSIADAGTVTFEVDGVLAGIASSTDGLALTEPAAAPDLRIDLPDLIGLITGARTLDDLEPGSWTGDRRLIESVLTVLEPPARYTGSPAAS